MKKVLMVLIMMLYSSVGFAQLEPYDDFDTTEGVSIISTVKVSENMIPHYLEGISKTWVPAMMYQKEKGYIESWDVYVSDLPESGDFNLVLVERYKDDKAVRGTEKRYKEVQEYMRKNVLSDEDQDEIVQNSYPNIRKINGQYRLRRVTFKNQ